MKNVKFYALTGVAAVAVVGGTFAYYNATQTFNNQFTTTGYSTSMTEKFNPADGENWEPGKEVDKEVYAINTGNGDVWVRVKLSEQWANAADVMDALTSGNPDFLAESAATSKQKDAEDGRTATDGTVVYKKLENITTDMSAANSWFLGTDGYYYYTSTLTNADGQNTTSKLLDSVTLCGDVDLGKEANITRYKLVDKDSTEVPVYKAGDAGWLTEKPATIPENQTLFTYEEKGIDSSAKGYSGANYALDITVDIVQADIAAADELAKGTWEVTPGQTR